MINELIKKIASDSGLDEDEIRMRIDEKKIELHGLISEEGACHLVAKELGVKLREQERLNIKNVIPGMQNVDIIGRIIRIIPTREFGGGKGKVASIFIADDSGSIRLSLWDSETEKIDDFKIGDTARVRGFVKENLGEPEIRLGRYGTIQKTYYELPKLEELVRSRRGISELGENQYAEIRATLVSVFESNPFYAICPTCNTRLKDDKCAEHGAVEPDYGIVLTGIIDDGSESMRIVLFRDNAEMVLGINKNDAKRLVLEKGVPGLINKIELGTEYIFSGRVKRNELFDRLEFIVSNIKNVDVKNEIELMINA